MVVIAGKNWMQPHADIEGDLRLLVFVAQVARHSPEVKAELDRLLVNIDAVFQMAYAIDEQMGLGCHESKDLGYGPVKE